MNRLLLLSFLYGYFSNTVASYQECYMMLAKENIKVVEPCDIFEIRACSITEPIGSTHSFSYNSSTIGEFELYISSNSGLGEPSGYFIHEIIINGEAYDLPDKKVHHTIDYTTHIEGIRNRRSCFSNSSILICGNVRQ
jgi:hypothetical protein